MILINTVNCWTLLDFNDFDHALLGLGAVSSGNMDQDMCFEISDPCFLEKYAKFIHR
jgi:hypothetical protein